MALHESSSLDGSCGVKMFDNLCCLRLPVDTCAHFHVSPSPHTYKSKMPWGQTSAT